MKRPGDFRWFKNFCENYQCVNLSRCVMMVMYLNGKIDFCCAEGSNYAIVCYTHVATCSPKTEVMLWMRDTWVWVVALTGIGPRVQSDDDS